MKILIAILILSLLIFVHEFGHFVVAKICGVHVKEFSLGMGPRLLKFKRKDTLYSIKLFLFGGSCAMSGMDENGDETGEGSYLSKSVWKRMAIIVAGPLFNIILAFLFSVILIGKVGYDPCVVGAVADNSPAYEAGLKPGDKIVKINKKNITFYEDYALYEMEHDGETMEITYVRDGEKYKTTVIPRYVDENVYQIGVMLNTDNADNKLEVSDVTDDMPASEAGIKKGDVLLSVNGEKIKDYQHFRSMLLRYGEYNIRIMVDRDGSQVMVKLKPDRVHQSYYTTGMGFANVWEKVSPIKTIGYSFKYTGYWSKSVFASIKMLINKKASINDVSGPVGIVNIVGNVVEETKDEGALIVLLNLLNFSIMISANLGIMNLLPIPALDGGKLFFLIIEAVRRKPVPREKEGIVHFVGVILLFLLTLAILFNDIRKLF